MACHAAHCACLRALRAIEVATTSERVWQRIHWWTLPTIVEALNELAQHGAVVRERRPTGFDSYRVRPEG